MNDDVYSVLISYGLASRDGQGNIKLREMPKDINMALNMKPDEIHGMSVEKLEQCLLIMWEYMFFIHLECNKHATELNDAKKDYEHKLSVAASKVSGGTVKERETRALEESEELKKLRRDYLLKENMTILTEKLIDPLKEKINIFKKVHDARVNEQRFGSRTQ